MDTIHAAFATTPARRLSVKKRTSARRLPRNIDMDSYQGREVRRHANRPRCRKREFGDIDWQHEDRVRRPITEDIQGKWRRIRCTGTARRTMTAECLDRAR
jgi:hypothetical protein